MEFQRGRYFPKWINCPEDKRDYDFARHGFMLQRERLAMDYCNKYNIQDLTLQEKNEIKDYWAQYGISIYDFSWHRMFYSVTGTHDPRFIPDLVAGLVIYEYYNDRTYENTWRDKNMFDRLLPDIPFPRVLGKKIRNRFITSCNSITDEKFAYEVFSKITTNKDIIIKNTRSTGFGRGVKKYHIENVWDVIAALKDWAQCENYIIQECIQQHDLLSRFNNSSCNMIRVCSYRHDNDVDILFAAVRAGIPGAITDISFVNGAEQVRVVGINNGSFAKKMLNQDGIIISEYSEEIPVPAWEQIVRIIKKNHLLVDNFDIIGWDFTIDKFENPICFEWNVQWPGTVLYQYVNGPLYGLKTETVLGFLNDQANRDYFIPCYMKIQ